MAAQVSQDHLFEVALSAIPEALSSGLRAAGLADPGLLDVFLRDSFDKLVAAGVTGDESGVLMNMEAGIVATGGTTMDTGMDDYEGRAYTSVSLIVSPPRLFSVFLWYRLSSPSLARLCTLVCLVRSRSCHMLGHSENSVNSRGLVVGTTERVPLKHRRVMKKRGKVESKSRDCESAFEKFSGPAGIPSSSKLEANVEHAQTGKTDALRDISEISEKCEIYLNPRISSIFAEDPSTHVKDRDEEIGKASKSQSTVMDSVLAPPDILLLFWTLVKDGVLRRGHESQFALLETAILKGARRALKRTAGSDNLTVAPPEKSSKPAEGTIRAARGRSVPLGSLGPSLKIPCALAGEVLRWTER